MLLPLYPGGCPAPPRPARRPPSPRCCSCPQGVHLVGPRRREAGNLTSWQGVEPAPSRFGPSSLGSYVVLSEHRRVVKRPFGRSRTSRAGACRAHPVRRGRAGRGGAVQDEHPAGRHRAIRSRPIFQPFSGATPPRPDWRRFPQRAGWGNMMGGAGGGRPGQAGGGADCVRGRPKKWWSALGRDAYPDQVGRARPARDAASPLPQSGSRQAAGTAGRPARGGGTAPWWHRFLSRLLPALPRLLRQATHPRGPRRDPQPGRCEGVALGVGLALAPLLPKQAALEWQASELCRKINRAAMWSPPTNTTRKMSEIGVNRARLAGVPCGVKPAA